MLDDLVEVAGDPGRRRGAAEARTVIVPPRPLGRRSLRNRRAAALLRQHRALAARDLHVVHSTVVLVLAGRESTTTRETTVVTRPGDLMPPPAGTLVDLLNEPGPSGAYEAASVAPDLSVTFSEAPGATSVDSAEALTVPEGFRAALLRARDVVLDPTVPLAVARHAVAEVSTWLDVQGPRFAGERPNRFSDRLRAHIAG